MGARASRPKNWREDLTHLTISGVQVLSAGSRATIEFGSGDTGPDPVDEGVKSRGARECGGAISAAH